MRWFLAALSAGFLIGALFPQSHGAYVTGLALGCLLSEAFRSR